MMPKHRIATVAIACLAAISEVSAQCPAFPCPTAPPGEPRVTLRAEALALGVNTSLGAVTALFGRGGKTTSLWKYVARGALGGAVNYAGKRITASGFSGAELLGRQTASVGASIVADARAGRGFLERTVLPLGIGRLYVDRSARTVTPRLDVAATLLTLFRALQPHTRFDLPSTLSIGAPVLIRESYGSSAGSQSLGVVVVRNVLPEMKEGTLTHEAIHVIQSDFTFLAWSEPVERKIFSQIASSHKVTRFMDLRLDGVLWAAFDAIAYADQPWEREAYYLTRHRAEISSGPYLLGAPGIARD